MINKKKRSVLRHFLQIDTLSFPYNPIRYVLEVLPGKEAEYTASHNEGFWPEMGEALVAHGAHNYSISLHAETRQLFAFVEIEDEALWDKIAETDTCQRWWKWMESYIVFGPDSKPSCKELKEVFFFKGNEPK